MHRFIRTALFASVCAFACTSALAAQQTLPLKRVVVTTSGLALYEHDGTVSGDADVNLSVRLDSVDDVLKSLTVLDNTGNLGGVSLPGREPLSQTFRDLPFAAGDLDSLAGFLNALRGAQVQIAAGRGTLTGRLLNVTPETESTPTGGVVTRNRVSVSTPDGIRTAVIESMEALKFTEPGVQAQLDRALDSLFSSRIKDQRTITLRLSGAGERPVAVAYIQAAPLWKSGYRVVLPDPEKAADKDPKAVLQGWAVMENTTGQDWDGVSVTLTSGAPVTYTQALYESYYVPRSELPVKVMDRILPRVDRGTVAMLADDESAERQGSLGHEGAQEMDKARSHGVLKRGMTAPAEMPMTAMADSAMSYEMAAANMPGAPPMPGAAMGGGIAPKPMGMAQAATALAEEASGQMVFTFPEPISLPAGNTLMIPFISRAFPVERLWVYQPETNATHPLAAVALKNESGNGLPPGILTLYDRSGANGGLVHVGDAEMPMTPKGEHRFIPFSLDAQTNIDRRTQEDRRLGIITIARGVLKQKAVYQNTTVYTIKAPAEEDRTIVIEHPRMPGWELEKPEGVIGEPEVTATHYRVRVSVAAGKSANLKLTLRREDEESFMLVDMNPEDLTARIAAAGKDLPPGLRKALETVGQMRAAAYDLEQKIQALEAERQSVYADQERMRQNIQAVSTNSALGKRYLSKMQEQEDRLVAIEDEIRDLNEKLADARAELANYVQSIQ